MILIPNKEKTAMLKENKDGKSYYVSPYFIATAIIKKIPDKCESEEIEIFLLMEKLMALLE